MHAVATAYMTGDESREVWVPEGAAGDCGKESSGRWEILSEPSWCPAYRVPGPPRPQDPGRPRGSLLWRRLCESWGNSSLASNPRSQASPTGRDWGISKASATTPSAHTASPLGQSCVFSSPECCHMKAITSHLLPPRNMLTVPSVEYSSRRTFVCDRNAFLNTPGLPPTANTPRTDVFIYPCDWGPNVEFGAFLPSNIFSHNTFVQMLLDHRPGAPLGWATEPPHE